MPRTLTPLALLAALSFGCGKEKAPTTFQSEAHDHAHERDKMLLSDAGPHHAALTAHLSQKEGNELDIFFETTDDPPKPVPLRAGKVVATATGIDGVSHPLEFVPAPPEERKGDPGGQCSHFVAKAPWMKPEDVLTVVAHVTVEGKPRVVTWTNFNPKKYAHHVE
jgi:hypothetical protein